jgi:hypothetical protein
MENLNTLAPKHVCVARKVLYKVQGQGCQNPALYNSFTSALAHLQMFHSIWGD